MYQPTEPIVILRIAKIHCSLDNKKYFNLSPKRLTPYFLTATHCFKTAAKGDIKPPSSSIVSISLQRRTHLPPSRNQSGEYFFASLQS